MNASTQHRDVLLLLALCPLAAASDTVVNAVGAGVLVLIIAPLTALALAPARRALTPDIRFAAALLLFAGVAACIEVLLRAYFFDLHDSLGVFAPLVVASIVLTAMLAIDAQSASASSVARLSLAIAAVLLMLGAARELVGRGSLFHDAGLMLGDWAQPFEMKVFRVDMGFLLGMLPPGAFIALGLLLAIRNWWVRRHA